MKKILLNIFALVMLLLLFAACERPNSPSFETEQVFSIPILDNIRYPLLGESGAIIDTTRSDFGDRFIIDPQTDLIILGFENDFPFGSFESVLPEINTSTIETSSSVDRLAPSINDEEEGSFETFTGLPPGSFSSGTQIPGASSGNVSITLGLGGLEQAVISEGGILFELRNELGFDISEVRAQVFSAGIPLGSEAVIQGLSHQSVEIADIMLSEGDVLEGEVILQLNIQWPTQQMQGDAGSFFIGTSGNDQLAVSEATAVFAPLRVIEFHEAEVDVEEFMFADDGDYVDVDEVFFNFSSIINQLDVDIDTLTISFPGIFERGSDGNFHPADTLSIVRAGDERIRRSSHPSNIGGQSFQFEASDLRISAPGNIIAFTIQGTTEDTRQFSGPDRSRTIQAGDIVEARLDPVNLKAKRIQGMLTPRFFVLGEDVADDTDVDLLDDQFNQRAEFDAIEFLSERLQNLSVLDTEMQLEYTTGIGIENKVYFAVLGRNSNGEEFLLKPRTGSPYAVSQEDSISGILYRGSPLQNSELITITTESADQQGEQTGVITFNDDNMNLSDFLSRLPVETFFVGKALANPLQRTAFVEQPVSFDAVLRVNFPFTLVTDSGPAVLTDSVDVSLSDLPDRRDDLYIAAATFTINYRNSLPLDIDMQFQFLDSIQDSVTTLPFTSADNVRLLAAPINDAGFSISDRQDSIVINLNEDQIDRLNETESIILMGQIITRDSQPVSLRARDFIELDIGSRFTLRTKVE